MKSQDGAWKKCCAPKTNKTKRRKCKIMTEKVFPHTPFLNFVSDVFRATTLTKAFPTPPANGRNVAPHGN